MGLFDSGGKGNSHAQTSSTSTTYNTQNTTNTVDNRVYQSDFGAISGATDVSKAALDLGQSALDSNVAVATAGLDVAQRAAGTSLDFAKSLFSTFANQTSDTVGAAINAVGDAQSNVLDFASSLFGKAIGAQQTLTDQNISGITQLATQVSQSAAQSNNETVQKIVLYIAIAAALVFLGPALLRSAK